MRVVLLNNAANKSFEYRRGGVVINTSSITSFEVPNPSGTANYSAYVYDKPLLAGNIDPAVMQWFNEAGYDGTGNRRKIQTEIINNAFDKSASGDFELNTNKPFFQQCKQRFAPARAQGVEQIACFEKCIFSKLKNLHRS